MEENFTHLIKLASLIALSFFQIHFPLRLPSKRLFIPIHRHFIHLMQSTAHLHSSFFFSTQSRHLAQFLPLTKRRHNRNWASGQNVTKFRPKQEKQLANNSHYWQRVKVTFIVSNSTSMTLTLGNFSSTLPTLCFGDNFNHKSEFFSSHEKPVRTARELKSRPLPHHMWSNWPTAFADSGTRDLINWSLCPVFDYSNCLKDTFHFSAKLNSGPSLALSAPTAFILTWNKLNLTGRLF